MKIYRVNEAAEHFEVSEKTIRRWIKSGLMIGRKIDRRLLIFESDNTHLFKGTEKQTKTIPRTIPGPSAVPNTPFLFNITAGNPPELLITVEPDGTVIIHKEGSAPEAARIFYKSVEIEGKTLLKHLEYWKQRALKAEKEIEEGGKKTNEIPRIIN